MRADISMSVSSGANPVGGLAEIMLGSSSSYAAPTRLSLVYLPILSLPRYATYLVMPPSLCSLTPSSVTLHHTQISPCPLISCGWRMLMNLWISAWGAHFQRETKNDFTACCVEYEFVDGQGESSKHQTTVLFWSVLKHRGSGRHEMDH